MKSINNAHLPPRILCSLYEGESGIYWTPVTMPGSLPYFILLSLYIHNTLSIVQMMKLGFSDPPEVTPQRWTDGFIQFRGSQWA